MSLEHPAVHAILDNYLTVPSNQMQTPTPVNSPSNLQPQNCCHNRPLLDRILSDIEALSRQVSTLSDHIGSQPPQNSVDHSLHESINKK